MLLTCKVSDFRTFIPTAPPQFRFFSIKVIYTKEKVIYTKGRPGPGSALNAAVSRCRSSIGCLSTAVCAVIARVAAPQLTLTAYTLLFRGSTNLDL